MKKNEVKNAENMNVVENNAIVADNTQQMEEVAQMEQFINDNDAIVPKNQRKKYDAMTLQQKVAKIKFWQDITQMREEARIKNSIPNRVKEMFDKRHATVDDAKAVMKFCQEFIDGFKQKEIEKLDAEIRKLQMMKDSLNA